MPVFNGRNSNFSPTYGINKKLKLKSFNRDENLKILSMMGTLKFVINPENIINVIKFKM